MHEKAGIVGVGVGTLTRSARAYAGVRREDAGRAALLDEESAGAIGPVILLLEGRLAAVLGRRVLRSVNLKETRF